MVEKKLVIGRISTVYGVKGWVKVFSHTSPMENIFHYKPWLLGNHNTSSGSSQWETVEVASGKKHGKGLIAHIKGVDDREAAKALVGKEIAIERDQLPAPEEGEYYWADLEGLEVVDLSGQVMGNISHLLETGSNDVICVKPTPNSIDHKERLIPYLEGDVVKEVDLEAGKVVVDWDLDF